MTTADYGDVLAVLMEHRIPDGHLDHCRCGIYVGPDFPGLQQHQADLIAPDGRPRPPIKSHWRRYRRLPKQVRRLERQFRMRGARRRVR